MLKSIDPLLGPQLLYVLRAMGHGDDIAIVDGNYPADGAGPELVRMDGHGAPRVLDAILSVMPLDDFVADPVVRMAVEGAPERVEPIIEEFSAAVARHEPWVSLRSMERAAFHNRVRRAYAIVATGERRLCGSIILKKGVIRPPRS